jgi:uncharacterized protein YejL (UPF0352 family)
MAKFNEKKVSKCHDDLIKVFQKHGLTVPEIVIVFGNLGYTLGASIEGYKGTGPSQDEVMKNYYKDPDRIGNALMAQGMIITTWYDKLLKLDAEEDKPTTEEQ